MFHAVWNTSGTLLAGAEWYNETMDVLSYLMDLTGHLLQMLPPMLLYFLCVPDDLFRYSKRKTFISFGIISVAILLCGTAAEHFVLKQILSIPPVFITSNALLIEFLALSVLARVYVLAPVWPNHIVFLLVFFWGTMQYNISNFILSISGRYGVYDLATVLVFAVTTVVLFPIAKRLMVPYAKEYLLTTDTKRSPAQIMVFVMAVLSMVQIFLASWEQSRRSFLALALMSVCITVTHWILVRQVVLQEQQTRTELHLLASQIRPHFILNTLNAICNLVDEDPQATRQAIYDFSAYLRRNYEALEQDTPVWFREELEHVKVYLSIEKMRFRDELEITIDTPVTEFEVPALTVQPMVENAIRHGLRGKEGTGHLWLLTRETDEAYEVVIRDDGVGMKMTADGEPASGNDGKHFGVRNGRARLQRMVGGRLLIESAPGQGTTVTIQVPKHAAEKRGGVLK